jgi:hypothetical protein
MVVRRQVARFSSGAGELNVWVDVVAVGLEIVSHEKFGIGDIA